MSRIFKANTRKRRPWRDGTIERSVVLPKWLFDLIPPQHRVTVATAAAIVGSRTDGKLVRLGQTSLHPRGQGRGVRLRFTPQENAELQAFANDACLSRWGSILRTTIMLGLGLPLVHDGVVSQTRTKRFRLADLRTMCGDAGIVFAEAATFKYITRGNEYGRY